jgi:hypothetical protein
VKGSIRRANRKIGKKERRKEGKKERRKEGGKERRKKGRGGRNRVARDWKAFTKIQGLDWIDMVDGWKEKFKGTMGGKEETKEKKKKREREREKGKGTVSSSMIRKGANYSRIRRNIGFEERVGRKVGGRK